MRTVTKQVECRAAPEAACSAAGRYRWTAQSALSAMDDGVATYAMWLRTCWDDLPGLHARQQPSDIENLDARPPATTFEILCVPRQPS